MNLRVCNLDLVDAIRDDMPELTDGCLRDIWDEVNIRIENNNGGNIQGALELIRNIRSTNNTRFNVTVHGYLASAAAVLYFHLLLNSKNSEIQNIRFIVPIDELEITLHRLRNENTNEVIQPENNSEYNLGCTIIDAGKQSWFVDDTFEQVLDFLKYINKSGCVNCKDLSSQIDDAQQKYYGNEDFVFSCKKEYYELLDKYLSSLGNAELGD